MTGLEQEVSRKPKRLASDLLTSRLAAYAAAAVKNLDVDDVGAEVHKGLSNCIFAVTIADPRGEDCPLIAVSHEFETMTGYARSEVVGVNCRFLNEGCEMNQAELYALRIASTTGVTFSAVIPNRKKSGEIFMNLLDLRGLTVAVNSEADDDLWFLVGIQADVTHLLNEKDEIDPVQLEALQQVAAELRDNLSVEIMQLAIRSTESGKTGMDLQLDSSSGWRVLSTPVWRDEAPKSRSLDCDAAELASNLTYSHLSEISKVILRSIWTSRSLTAVLAFSSVLLMTLLIRSGRMSRRTWVNALT